MTVAEAHASALQHHQAGRLAEAEVLCAQILAVQPEHLKALHLLGLIAHQTGRNDVAVELIGKATAISPGVAAYHSNLGLVFGKLGRCEEAVASHRRAILLRPDFAEAHSNLGDELRRLGHLEEAVAECRRAIELKPDFAVALNNLGVALADQGKSGEAAAAYREAIRFAPAFAEAHNNLGSALCEMGLLDEALAACRDAERLQPRNADTHNNLGTVLSRLGRLDEAVAAYRQAIALEPGNFQAHSNLGNALRCKDQLDEAIAACCQAIAFEPGYPEAHSNLGVALFGKGQLDEAIAACRQAITLKPDYPEAHSNLGVALSGKGRLDEAIAAYRQAIALKSNNPEAHYNLGGALREKGQLDESLAAYRRALALKPGYTEAHSNLIFTLDLMGSVDVGEQQAERARWEGQHARRFGVQVAAHGNEADPGRKLRVGYVSADFRRHSAYYAFGGVISGHDRGGFEVYCYSGVKREDDATARLRGAAQGWVSTAGTSDEALAGQVRRDRIDILVDLSGHSAGNRLLMFARKPAPVQVTAWGHAHGTGLSAMDYLFADPVVVPVEERGLFAEEIIDLPCTLCYEPPEYLPAVSALPCLQGHPLTYGCVNRLEKITDRAIALWGRILEGAPGARLLMKDKGFGEGERRMEFLSRLREVGGIEEGRVMLLGRSPHAEHLKVFGQIDVGLDPFPQNGGISTAEALVMGVPVVTLRGQTPAGRITESLLSVMGMREWVAQGEDEYVRIALEAGREPGRIAKLREELPERVKGSAWGEVGPYTRAVEKVYRQMWKKRCANQSASIQS